MAEKRTRNWASVFYNDYDGVIAKLSDCHVSFMVSPFHDSDFDPDGNPKKPHWHVLVCFDGVKTESQARDLFGLIDGVGCEKVNSLRGYARYLCHLDNPDKAQYDINDVFQFGSVDYYSIISLPTDKYDCIGAMMDWVDLHNCISLASLLRYARANNEIWFRCLCDNSCFILREYIKSRTWELTNSVITD